MLSSSACTFTLHVLLFLPTVFSFFALYSPKLVFSPKWACAQSWLYIRLIIIHLVFFHNFVVWIMSCISSIYFDVFNFVVWIMSCISLLNGVVTPLFRLGRGLKQGCTLSPLLFLLINKGLSRLLKEVEGKGSIKRVHIGVSCNITHLLFVDDILVLFEDTRIFIKRFKGIMDLFCKENRMVINMENSMMTL
jgi:hypothetical protein